jgi:hypothetical protein
MKEVREANSMARSARRRVAKEEAAARAERAAKEEKGDAAAAATAAAAADAPKPVPACAWPMTSPGGAAKPEPEPEPEPEFFRADRRAEHAAFLLADDDREDDAFTLAMARPVAAKARPAAAMAKAHVEPKPAKSKAASPAGARAFIKTTPAPWANLARYAAAPVAPLSAIYDSDFPPLLGPAPTPVRALPIEPAPLPVSMPAPAPMQEPAPKPVSAPAATDPKPAMACAPLTPTQLQRMSRHARRLAAARDPTASHKPAPFHAPDAAAVATAYADGSMPQRPASVDRAAAHKAFLDLAAGGPAIERFLPLRVRADPSAAAAAASIRAGLLHQAASKIPAPATPPKHFVSTPAPWAPRPSFVATTMRSSSSDTFTPAMEAERAPMAAPAPAPARSPPPPKGFPAAAGAAAVVPVLAGGVALSLTLPLAHAAISSGIATIASVVAPLVPGAAAREPAADSGAWSCGDAQPRLSHTASSIGAAVGRTMGAGVFRLTGLSADGPAAQAALTAAERGAAAAADLAVSMAAVGCAAVAAVSTAAVLSAVLTPLAFGVGAYSGGCRLWRALSWGRAAS